MKRFLFLLSTCLIFSGIGAQTPGLIIRDGGGVIPPATRSTVLDPNQDGWSSVTTAGFVGSDIGAAYSEIPYKPIPPLFPEPTGDLRRGPNSFFSEIVKADPGGTGFYMFYKDPTPGSPNSGDELLLFRLRISGLMSGSKGYSALMDIDRKIFGTGPDADPTYQAQTTGTNGNPGFEYEVVYETNFRIAVYDVNNACGTAPLPVWSVDLSSNPQFAQTSIALTTDGGDPDYFYDWYVPVTAFTGSAGPIISTTPIRVQTATVMSPQGSLCGPVSDLYGDDDLYGTTSSQYVASIQGQPAFTPNDMTTTGGGVGPVCTAPPTINFPIASGASSVSGTWTKASYSSLTTATINLYNGSTLIGTTSATSGGSWTVSGLSPTALANNDVITAKAQATGESMCLSSNAILILDCTPATTSPCPVVSCFTDKGAEGTGIVGATLRIYRVLSTGITTDFTLVIPAGGAWGWAASGSTGNNNNVCNTGSKDLLDGTYFVTQQEPGKCESACLTPYCVGFVATSAPVITTDPIFTGTSTLTGTAVAGSTVRLYLNNILKATATATGGNYSFPISGYYAQVGDVFSVTAQNTGQCVSALVSKIVQCFVSNPIINTTNSGVLIAGTQITGKSSEPVGTTVTVYNGATNAIIGTATVVAGGNWTLTTPTAVAATTYYARHTGTPCGTSGASATVTTLAGTSAARCGTITSPVNENAVSVSGTLTGSLANTLVTLYIDETPIGTFTTSNTSWGPIIVNTTYLNKIYPGGVLSIGIKEPGKAEVICPTTITVICVPPATPILSNPLGTAGVTPGTLTYTITNSQAGILYTIEDDRTGTIPAQTIGTDRSISAFGNGGSLILTTYVLPEPGDYRFKISALKLTGPGCTEFVVTGFVNPYNSTTGLNDENSTWQDVNVSGGVIANDFDAENNTQTFGSFLTQGAVPGAPITSGATVSGVDKLGAPVASAGTLTFAADGSYTFDPSPTFTGTVTVPYSVCDNGNLSKCDTAYLTITVDPFPSTTNSVIANNDENVSYGAPVSGGLLVNDRDPQGNAFTVTSFTGGTVGTPAPVAGVDQYGNPVANAGTLTINADGTYTFVPTAGFVGSINVPYTITDALGATSTAVLHIDVLRDPNGPANDPPVAGDDFAYTNVNTPVTSSFVNNDSDPNANPISVNGTTINTGGPHTPIGAPVATAQGGTVQFYADGTYTYTPPAGYVGPDNVPYTICDVTAIAPQPLCNTAFIHLLVGVDNSTDAVNDENSTWQDVNVSGGVIANDFDAENNTQTFGSFLTQGAVPGAPITSGATVSGVDKLGAPVASAGTLTFAADGSYTFDPSPTFTGTVTIPYRLCDNGNLSKCDTAYLTITVDPLPTSGINTVIANNDENISYGGPVSNTLFANDRDPQGDAFTVTAVTGGTPGAPFTVAGTDANGNPVANAGTLVINADGTYTYTPTAGFVGSINVPYTITDALGATSTAVLHIDVVRDPNGPLNDPPFAGDDFGYTTVNKPVSGNFIGNDTDPNSNPLSYMGTTIVPAGPATPIGAPVATAQGGTVQFYANGTYLYTPPVGYVGPDNVNYTVCDVTAIAPQPLCTDAQIHLLIGPGISIAGKVWDDADGNVIDAGAGEPETNIGGTLYVNLVDALGNVVATTAVLPDGSYNFTNITPGVSYTVQLSTNQGVVGNPAPAVALPAGWVNTGETRNGIIDGGTLGVIDTRNYGFTNTINFDFGIEQLPNTDPHTTNIPQPTVNQFITLNGGANPPILSGIDPEDCNAGCTLASKSVIIDVLPANSELYYNGILVTAGQQINNFDPSLLQVKITSATLGAVSTSFQYSFVDAAGKKDPTPATYTLTWLTPLPVTGLYVTARLNNAAAIIDWKTETEINSDYFVVERSTDNVNFTQVGTVAAAGNSTTPRNYSFTDDITALMQNDVVYYRIRQIDIDARFKFSNVAIVKMTKTVGIQAWPNPFTESISININSTAASQINIKLINVPGQVLRNQSQSISRGTTQVTMRNLNNLASGIYFLQIEDGKGGISEVIRFVKE